MTSPLLDRALDALDDAPSGRLEGECPYLGPVATIQWLARSLRCSDSAALGAVHALHRQGLVQVVDALDPHANRRRLFVFGWGGAS